jgi:hypothetical protein
MSPGRGNGKLNQRRERPNIPEASNIGASLAGNTILISPRRTSPLVLLERMATGSFTPLPDQLAAADVQSASGRQH